MRMFIVDAFAERPFTGNPAAVCMLDEARSAKWMQSVAQEMNLSETAFVRPLSTNLYEIRWFTPAVEVDLCGHATLASAHILRSQGVAEKNETIVFQSLRSGTLKSSQTEDDITLDFPATEVNESPEPAGLFDSLGLSSQKIAAAYVGRTKFDVLVALKDEQQVRSTKPNFSMLKQVDARGIIVTSRSAEPGIDFVSRFFAPAAGIDEDPVTGSAHCALGPYWGHSLGIDEMVAHQASARGGTLRVRVDGDRVHLTGKAFTTLCGEFSA